MSYRSLSVCMPLALACFFVCSASADMVTFEFATGSATNGSDLDGLTSATTSASSGTGITLTLSAQAFVAGGSGEFNGLPGSPPITDFGINATGGGDDTDAIDGDLGAESIVFSVTSNVPLSSLSVLNFDLDRFTLGNSDMGSLVFDGGTNFAFENGDLSTQDLLLVNESITVGQTFTLAFVGGDGFGLESIAFDAVAVPEPSSLALLGLASLGCVVRRRRQ